MKKVTVFSIFAFVTLLSIAPIGFALYPSTTPWSMYRYDANHSGTTPSDVPTSNNTLWGWGTSAAGAISMKSTPLVVDGRVIFNVFSKAYALDETDGIKLWEHQTNGWLTAPSYADGRVFFGLSNNAGGVICLNASTGEEIWNQDASPYFVMGNPLVYEGIVYAGITDNNTRAFNATTGHYEWGYKTDGPVYSSPAADGDILFFGSDDTKLYALDVSGATPVSLWNFTANGAIRSTPTISGDKVFFGSDNNMLYTVNKMTGELIWRWATTTPSAKIGNGVAVANDIVYVTSTDLPKVYALHVDVAPGNYTENDFDIRYWTKDLKTPLSGSISGLNEPIYAGGKIVVTSTGGDPAMLWSLDADVGNVLWDRGSKWWPSFGNAVVADGHVWFNIFWWDPGSYAMYCIGDLFPPTTYLYTMNARGTSYNVALETNSTITNFNTANLETQGKIGFNVQGIETSGMCNITLPDAMLGEPFNVTVGGEQPFYVAEPTGNGTHTWLYFTYNHTTSQTVEITGTIPPTTYHYTVSAGGTSFDVALETNSTISDFNTTDLETQGKIRFGVAGINETTGMCNITIPNNMLDGELNVTVDGEQPLYSTAPLNNGTHTSLYFTYNNTIPHAVEITGTTFIPEFPIITIVPMLITTLFMTLVQLKRKRNK